MEWEYRIERIFLSMALEDNRPAIVEMLNNLGQEGWEAVNAWSGHSESNAFVLLKREKRK
jgi:hypothetical protein